MGRCLQCLFQRLPELEYSRMKCLFAQHLEHLFPLRSVETVLLQTKGKLSVNVLTSRPDVPVQACIWNRVVHCLNLTGGLSLTSSPAQRGDRGRWGGGFLGSSPLPSPSSHHLQPPFHFGCPLGSCTELLTGVPPLYCQA